MSRRPVQLAALAVVSMFLVSGCSEATEKAEEERVEQAIEDGSGGDTDVDIDGNQVEVATSEGMVSMGGGLPDDFPEDDVPLIVGDVLMAMGKAGEGFSVTTSRDGAGEWNVVVSGGTSTGLAAVTYFVQPK